MFVEKKNENMYNFIFLVVKRIFDIIASIIGLVLCIPIFILTFILMKIEDPKGDFIFKQVRVGKDVEEFEMFKIRSMCSDAENEIHKLASHNEISGAMFKMENDPRITKIGRFIRKTSIDELPQLWNVLKGDMSLVGPRPPLVREVEKYSSYDIQRLTIKPGCTGLWQVSGRNRLSFDEMVKLDMEYIEKRSLLFDLIILFKTIVVVITGDGM